MEINKARELFCKSTIRNDRMVEILSKWDEQKTILDNSIAIGISRINAQKLVLRFNLGFKQVRKMRGILRQDAFALLRQNGWSLEKIGKAFHVTRQCVHETLNRRPKEMELGRPIKALSK